MAYNKGLHSSSSGGSQRGRPYVLILLITFGAALLGVMVLHKLRERRIYNLLVKEKDHQLLALQLLLQKERDRTKELRGKNEEMKGKIYTLRSQKMDLAKTVADMKSTLDSLKDEQKVMESAFEEKQNELRMMQGKGRNEGQGGSEIIVLREKLKHKEAEIEDLTHRLEILVKNRVSVNDHPNIFTEIVTENGTMAAQAKTENDNKENDESSSESTKYESDDKGVTNEDASESKLTKSKDDDIAAGKNVAIHTHEELKKTNEDSQDDDDSAGVTSKDIDTEVVDDREKKAIREEEPRQQDYNSDGGGQNFKVKQLVARGKRKYGHASRTKGKRTIVKNRLRENNENFERHEEVNMENRKVYIDEKDDLKDTRIGEVSDEEHFAREDEERDNNSPRKDKLLAKLPKAENHESKENTNDMAVNNTNHEVTNSGNNIYPEKERLDQIRQSEEHVESLVQQNWSRRHINRADKNAGDTKPNMLLEEPEEVEVLNAQKLKKDAIDSDDDEEDNDFSKESQSDIEDEKEYYKEEIDESEFRSGL